MASASVAPSVAARRLDPLRDRLAAVRGRRLTARRLTGWSAVVVGVLAALLAALAVDRLFSLPRAGRLWLWGGIVATAIWAFRRYAWPQLRVRETDLDVALAMEKAHGIDSDFVAALQFEQPAAGDWGSETLRTAVVDYVSEFGRQWTTAAPLWNRLLAGRAAWVAALLGVFVAVGMASPGTLRAFVARMGLASARYPTWTRIERLSIAGREVNPAEGGDVKIPAGRAVRVEVTCGGRPVTDARADFVSDAGGAAATVALAAAEGATAGPLAGELANLTESAALVVRAGDDWTERVRLVAVPAPIVEAGLRVEPPAYARGAGSAATGRQAAVLEGSNVVIEVRCLNKDLASAEVVIDGRGIPLVREADPAGGRDRFVLSGSGSPLAEVREPIAYEVRAVDVDGLSPERPPAGAIRIRPDAAPQITAEAVTRYVLPTARPRLTYTVRDDYGVAEVRAIVEVIHPQADSGGVTERVAAAPDDAAAGDSGLDTAEPTAVVAPQLQRYVLLRATEPPWVGDALPRTAQFAVPLSDLGLQKGDFARVHLEAVDFRGSLPGQTAQSVPVDLTVTDESGVLAALQESENKAATELQTIIEDQLRVEERQ